MPPRLPERYRLNIRLGSDGDIEEWLASDDNLDRPVLIRYLEPESSPERHQAFLAGVRSAAALTEIHLQRVFAAGETTASAYSVSEWDGGVTIADRLRVGEGLPVEEFLPNASKSKLKKAAATVPAKSCVSPPSATGSTQSS